ncbi:hypothetical protein ACH42_08415 [Endozoicomonas sp. (ex Bugula neritina AB1)]|nr:hypothetical protein ACH42_08415 [Endozoicomonas sp. (ex Bugula neritina AB1)]
MFGNIDWTALKFLLDLLSTLAVFLLFIWTMIKRKQKDNSDDIKNLDLRVRELENNQALMATHEDIGTIRSEITGLSEKLDAANHLLHVLHEHTLNKKKG